MDLLDALRIGHVRTNFMRISRKFADISGRWLWINNTKISTGNYSLGFFTVDTFVFVIVMIVLIKKPNDVVKILKFRF
jgi:hypothetical protein